jgi:hypothetical protein
MGISVWPVGHRPRSVRRITKRVDVFVYIQVCVCVCARARAHMYVCINALTLDRPVKLHSLLSYNFLFYLFFTTCITFLKKITLRELMTG